MAFVTLQDDILNNKDTIFYHLFAGEEISEGPLDSSAYAQTDAPGVGGTRLSSVEAGVGVDIITFEDPEVEFAAALSGNVIVGPLDPLLGDAPEPKKSALPKPRIYTVQEGDTIGSIAEAQNISVATIQAANGLGENTVIKPGDHITLMPFDGVMHTVVSGDTVSEIANKYEVKSTDIIAANELPDGAKLSISQKIIVPGGKIPVAPRYIARDDDTPTDPTPDTPPANAPVSEEGWLWPTSSQHISQAFRWGHTGIDIDNRARPPVYAAAEGKVEFTGWLGGYGNLIIVNHGNGVQTYYAHLDKIYIGRGEGVNKGQAIGKMGSTGRSTGPHLHFEVRRHGRPINPMGVF